MLHSRYSKRDPTHVLCQCLQVFHVLGPHFPDAPVWSESLSLACHPGSQHGFGKRLWHGGTAVRLAYGMSMLFYKLQSHQ